MKLFQLWGVLLFIFSIQPNPLTYGLLRKNVLVRRITTSLLLEPEKDGNPSPNKLEKPQALFQLIRGNNILPTMLLCVSGGWIMNPSIPGLLHSPSFIVSVLDTLLIMSASMVLNDIYDINIDRINSPHRPLVNGQVKIYEAVVLAFLLIGTSEYLTFAYLPENLQFILQLVILQIGLYTPVLKRMLILKNLSCASLVAFSLFFSGLAASNTVMNTHKNFSLLSTAMSLIFFGSWCNELLLDMRDREGDQQNNLATIPTLFGNQAAWILSAGILNTNIIGNTLSIAYLYDDKTALVVPAILSPLIVQIYRIKRENYSMDSIQTYMETSNYPLVALLAYLCAIAQ
jgi:geranylgeranylglycerol-phosphate geranylgeranyltransferase